MVGYASGALWRGKRCYVVFLVVFYTDLLSWPLIGLDGMYSRIFPLPPFFLLFSSRLRFVLDDVFLLFRIVVRYIYPYTVGTVVGEKVMVELEFAIFGLLVFFVFRLFV